MRIDPATPRSLQYWYGRINRSAFGGKLPKVEIKFVRSVEYLASTQKKRLSYWIARGPRGEKVSYVKYRFIIRFNRRLKFSQTICVETLAHEMVHVEHWGWNHTTRFENRVMEVIRKAKLGRFL